MLRSAIHGFTLVELIIVMTLLAVVMALSAPSLSRSMRERNLGDEAGRFLAATEYARNEAVSQGVPMIVWVDPPAQRFGVEAKAGFEGDDARAKQFALNPDVRLETDEKMVSGSQIPVAEFEADGAPTPTSAESLRMVDRFQSTLTIARTSDRWGYEILADKK